MSVGQAGAMPLQPPTQYATDGNLAARQRLWGCQQGGVEFVQWVLGLVDWEGQGAVLDVGCGNGRYLEALQARGVDVVGCDVSLGMLGRAGSHRVVNADAALLPFREGGFGVVLAAHMLYHVADLAETVRELRRVLAPTGVLVAVTNGSRHLRSLRDLVEVAVTASDPGWRMIDSATRAFSLDSGPGRLTAAFTSVDVVRPVDGGLVLVDDVTVITDYLWSVGDVYGPEISRPWADVVASVGRQVEDIIDREAVFVTSGDVGALICR
jgi:SAM-dependent methyltransferase